MKSFAPKPSRRRPSGRHLSRALTLALVLVAALVIQQLGPVVSAVNLAAIETAVTQNFDSIGTSATATLPTDFRVDKNQGVRTVGSYSSAVTATEIQGGANMSATANGGIYNFGSGTTTTGADRAVGFLSSTSTCTGVVISQVYGGAGCGTAGCSTYNRDYIELFNSGSTPQSLNGWSVQYGAATGSSWQVTSLTNVTLQPGQYYLVGESTGAAGTGVNTLPTADASGTIAMSATAGKVVLSSSTTAYVISCPSTNVVDLVGYGATANCFETAAAPAPSTTTADGRANGGCTDANNNSTDFSATTPNPRNTSTTAATCGVNVNGGNLYAKYTNTTGSTLSALRISYDVEKYRNGSNPAGFRVQLSYSTTGAAGTWTTAGANFLTSFAADADNNGFATAPGSTSSVTNKVLTLPIANNSDIYLAWNYGVTTGTTVSNAQALGIDNISVAPVGGPISPNGSVITDIQGTDDGGYAMVLQPDGKIVVGGYAVNVSGNKDFALVRYNYDGTLDSTFGTGGKVTTDFNSTSERIWGLALQSDGKIVAAGETVNLSGNNDIALARYNSNGTLDTSGFGLGTGTVTTDHLANPNANNAAYAVALSGTNIIVAGYEAVSGVNNFMVAKYSSAGVLDATFGSLGVTTTGFSGGGDVARALAIQTDGKIVLAGYSKAAGFDDFAVARYTTAGALDTTFVSGQGKAAIDLGNNNADQAFAVGIDGAGRIILAGSTYNGTDKDFAFVCYTSTGALDTSGFGGGTGIKKTDFGSSPDVAQSILVRNDGSFVAAGVSRYSDSSDDFAIASYNSSGGPDLAFNGGRLTYKISNYDERIYAVAQGLDNKLVVAGFATQTPISNPVKHDFAVARFNLNGTTDSSTPPALNQPDLYTTKVGPVNSVIAGQQFTYTISVENRGGAAATNVVVTDPIPAGVTFVSATNGATFSSGTVTKTVGTMVPGASVSFQITVTAGPPRTVANTATATLTETDSTPANNAATEYTHIIGPDLYLTKLGPVNPNTVIAGQQFTYSITVSNGGDAAAMTVFRLT